MTKEDFVIVAGGIENANDGQLDSTEILKNGNWKEGTLQILTIGYNKNTALKYSNHN